MRGEASSTGEGIVALVKPKAWVWYAWRGFEHGVGFGDTCKTRAWVVVIFSRLHILYIFAILWQHGQGRIEVRPYLGGMNKAGLLAHLSSFVFQGSHLTAHRCPFIFPVYVCFSIFCTGLCFPAAFSASTMD